MFILNAINFVAKNKFFHLFLGTVTIAAGMNEIWGTIVEDILSGNIHSGHGIVVLGVWHVCRSLGEFIEGTDYLNEGLE